MSKAVEPVEIGGGEATRQPRLRPVEKRVVTVADTLTLGTAAAATFQG